MNELKTEKSEYIDLFARLTYLTELFARRRVLVVTDQAEPGQFIHECNARYVCSISQNPEIEEFYSTNTIEYQSENFRNLSFRDGMFDIAIVPNMATADDPITLIEELKRVVGRRGIVIASSKNPSCDTSLIPQNQDNSIDYYDFYDMLSTNFDSVQMVGQAPFAGYALSDLEISEVNAVSFDDSLLQNNTEEIEWFIAICAASPVKLDNYSVIQIPISSLGNPEEQQHLADQNQVLLLDNETLKKEAAQLEEDLRLIEDELRNRAPTQNNKEEVEKLKEELRAVKLELGTRGVKIETLQNNIEKEKMEAEAARERAVKLAKQFDNERKASQAREIERQFAQRQPGLESKAEVENLKTQLKETKESLTKTEQEKEVIREKAVQNENQTRQLRSQLEEALKKEKQFIAREDTLMDKLATAHKELSKALEKEADKTLLENLKKALTQKEEEGRELSQKYAQIKAEFEKTKFQLDNFEKNLKINETEIEEDNTILENKIIELAKQLATANTELERRETIVRDLTTELSNIKNSNQAISENSIQWEKEQNELKLLQEQLNAKIEDIKTRDIRILRLEGEIQSASWKIDELTARNNDAQKKLEEAISSLKEEQSSNIDQSQYSTLLCESQNLKQKLYELENQNKTLLETINKHEIELAAAHGSSSGNRRARVEAELALSSLEIKHQELLNTQDELLKNFCTIEEEMAAQMGALMGHRKARIEAELEIGVWQNKYKKAKIELDETIVERVSIENKLDHVQSESERLTFEKESTETKFLELENSKKSLKATLKNKEQQYLQLQSRLNNHINTTDLRHLGRIEAEAQLFQLQKEICQLKIDKDTLAEQLRINRGILSSSQDKNPELEETYSKISNLEKHIDELQKKLKTSQSQNIILQKNIDEQNNITNSQHQQIQETNNVIEQLNHQLNVIKAEASEYKNSFENLNNELKNSRKTLEETQDELSKVSCECEARGRETGHLKNELGNANAEISRLKNDVHGCDREIERLRNELANKDGFINQQNQQIDDSNREIEKLQNELANKNGFINQQNQQIADSNKENSRLSHELNENQNHSQHLESQLNKKNNDSSNIQEQLQFTNSKLESLQDEHAKLHDQLDTLTEELHQTQSQKEETLTKLAKLENLLIENEATLEKTKKENNEFKKTCEEYSNQILQLEEKAENISSRIDKDASSKIDLLELDIARLKKELTIEQERTYQAGADAAKLARNSENLNQQIQENIAEKDKLENENKKTIEALGFLKAHLEQKENNLEKLTIKLEKIQSAQKTEQQNQLQAQNESKEKLVATLNEKLEEQKEEILKLQHRISTQSFADDENKKLSKQTSDLSASLETRSQQLQENTTLLAKCKADLEDRDKHLDDLKNQLDENNEEFAKLLSKTEMLQEVIGQKDVQISDSISKIESLTSQIPQENFQLRIETLEKELNEAKRTANEIQMASASKNLEISHSKGALKESQEQLTRAREQVQKLNAQLQSLKSESQKRISLSPDELATLKAQNQTKDAELENLKNDLDITKDNLEVALAEIEELTQQNKKLSAPIDIPDDVVAKIKELEASVENQKETILDMEEAQSESKPLIESLTQQLEQREQALNKMEKKIRMLGIQLKETEGDSIAWDMELKFRDAKIAALEEEIDELRAKK